MWLSALFARRRITSGGKVLACVKPNSFLLESAVKENDNVFGIAMESKHVADEVLQINVCVKSLEFPSREFPEGIAVLSGRGRAVECEHRSGERR